MTPEIAAVLLILVAAFVLFVTEWVRMDVVALLVLGVLAVSGLVGPADALAGFSNPAVITVWAMFMLSAALTQTGVATVIGRHVLRLAGRSQTRMVVVIMLTSAVLSAFMNNIGVAALLLPVVLDVARRTDCSPSRLLMPLAFGSLLGGLTTLIGTPPNLLVSEALRENGLTPFALFDFVPVGGVVMLAGIAFVAVAGVKLLPQRDPGRDASLEDALSLPERYALRERTALMRVRPGSALIGKTLAQSRLGSATGLNMFAVIRDRKAIPTPPPDFVLQANDRLEVGGKLDRFSELRGWRELVLEREHLGIESLVSGSIELAELRVSSASELAGLSLGEVGFRKRFGVIALALRRGADVRHGGLAETKLAPGDRLLVEGGRRDLEALRRGAGVEVLAASAPGELVRRYGLEERIFAIRVPADSVLVGRSLAESRLGDALALGVVGVVRADRTAFLPRSDERLQAEDRLLVRGRREDLEVFRGLQELEIEKAAPGDISVLASEQAGLVEAMLAPRGSLAGKTLRQLDFRARYGLQALAILREGRAVRSNLRDMALRFGDVLLLFGPREKALLLGRDPDFLVLTMTARAVPSTERAPLAAAIMAAVLVPVLAGWLPIAVAAVVGATLMVLARCLTMEEAYRSVEWRSIFLIAGMLPLGVAMQTSGAAGFLADGVLTLTAPLGPWGAIAGLYLVTAVATMVIPTAALVVLMAPIVLKTAADLGISPHAVMMAVAMAASASFTSPIAHPANLLVMGPGGYRFVDYVKVGVPLTLVVLVVTLLVLPLAWPLFP